MRNFTRKLYKRKIIKFCSHSISRYEGKILSCLRMQMSMYNSPAITAKTIIEKHVVRQYMQALLRHWVKMPRFIVSCSKCSFSAKSRSSVSRHFARKHSGCSKRTLLDQKFTLDGKTAPAPELQTINKKSTDYKNYKIWLAAVVERINDSHHPCLPG